MYIIICISFSLDRVIIILTLKNQFGFLFMSAEKKEEGFFTQKREKERNVHRRDLSTNLDEYHSPTLSQVGLHSDVITS